MLNFVGHPMLQKCTITSQWGKPSDVKLQVSENEIRPTCTMIGQMYKDDIRSMQGIRNLQLLATAISCVHSYTLNPTRTPVLCVFWWCIHVFLYEDKGLHSIRKSLCSTRSFLLSSTKEKRCKATMYFNVNLCCLFLMHLFDGVAPEKTLTPCM